MDADQNTELKILMTLTYYFLMVLNEGLASLLIFIDLFLTFHTDVDLCEMLKRLLKEMVRLYDECIQMA